MSTPLTTTIVKADTCPDLTINNTSVYPTANSDFSHWIDKFTKYVSLNLLKPNGVIDLYNQTDQKYYLPLPSTSLTLAIEMCLSGLFTADFVQLPTPPETVGAHSNDFNGGDNFYYQGVIYHVKTTQITLPGIGFTNAQLIAAYLTANFIEVILPENVASQYKSSIRFRFICSGLACLKSKLAKLNCLILAEPTRTDICELDEFQEVIKLFELTTTDFIDSELPDTPPAIQQEIEYFNYVNQVCCSCGDCGDNSKDC